MDKKKARRKSVGTRTGVYYVERVRKGKKTGKEKYFYGRYRLNGQQHEVYLGRQYGPEGMTGTKAISLRAKIINGECLPPVQQRKKDLKQREKDRQHTLEAAWDRCGDNLNKHRIKARDRAGWYSSDLRFKKYIVGHFGENKSIKDLTQESVKEFGEFVDELELKPQTKVTL